MKYFKQKIFIFIGLTLIAVSILLEFLEESTTQIIIQLILLLGGFAFFETGFISKAYTKKYSREEPHNELTYASDFAKFYNKKCTSPTFHFVFLTVKDYNEIPPENKPEINFCRFFGSDVFPDSVENPTFNGKKIPIFCRLDFESINSIGHIPFFPTSGRIYIFLDVKKVNDPELMKSKRTTYFFDQGEVFDIVYSDDHTTPINTKDDIYLAFEPSYHLLNPDTDEKTKKLLGKHADDAFGDQYRLGLLKQGLEIHMGGISLFAHEDLQANAKKIYGLDYTILFVVPSFDIDSSEESKTLEWHNGGILYFLIPTEDLINKNFSRVKLILVVPPEPKEKD